ncbi:MAG TPA: PAP/fibrillin family protein [Oscillatoriaceae cyanobacterium M33_DOE_052]|uniref:Fibrillin n=1 Tax=Planktothricoides sp. SpSt-374 TaxID=2282167 RepID=A0A7C3ZMC7_9CYAN|nr:PAP/fibrillin family protein [Oscillatoriaceae cyanobacterium M33_DOE_052]
MLGKAELLQALVGKNRGVLATKAEKQAIQAAIASLEDRNPTNAPTEALSLLEGNWQLLYTTSSELLNIDRLPLAKLGPIYQCIRSGSGKIYNIAEIYSLPLLESIVSVSARFEALSPIRLGIKFERNITGPMRLLSYQNPDQFIATVETGKKFLPIDITLNPERQQGWVDITYLDENLRIGRGNGGSIFVLSKSTP